MLYKYHSANKVYTDDYIATNTIAIEKLKKKNSDNCMEVHLYTILLKTLLAAYKRQFHMKHLRL